MRTANLDGRLHLITEAGALDVAVTSRGRFDARPQNIYGRWAEFTEWARELDPRDARQYPDRSFGSPAPAPRQVLAVGLNYQAHADENAVTAPDAPAVFTKFPTSITGPSTDVRLPTSTVDWEAELVVVIGLPIWQIAEDEAWSHVAGLTVGQDLSERTAQFAGPAPQWSLAKSHPGFSPMGPILVSPDEFADPDDLAIGCSLNGDIVQQDRTSNMIFSIPVLLARISKIIPLLPGDVLFTGTPSGVGLAQSPPRFIAPGDQLTTWIEGIGELHQTFSG
jgi:2-keto-4-pentenoate hydratase/2-oxohepta-3-ene-1,7-dioic acid hydratase in catechol pathway